MIQDQKSFTPHRAYAGNETRIIEQFQPLVRKLAWHLAGSAGPVLDVDDLMQVGLIALTECARRHDRPTEDGLAAYAKLRVRGAMIDAIRKAQVQSRNSRAEWQRIESARQALLARNGREPNDAELAREMNLPSGEVADMRRRSAPLSHVNLSDSYDEHNTAFASDDIGGEEWLLQTESREQLAAAISSLSERHRLVVQLYFLEELNLAEIATVLDVSVPRVHQLKAAALTALRDFLSD